MKIIIRKAETADAATVLKYTRKLLSEAEHNAPFAPGEFSRTLRQQEEILENCGEQQNSSCFLAFCGQTLVGELSCKGYERIPLQHVTILSMSVDFHFRGQGIGSRLMTAAMRWARETNVVKRIELCTFATNQTAQALYKKFGFLEEGLRKHFVKINNQYIDDVLMAKLI